MPFDLSDELGRGLVQALHVEHQNAHFAGHQKIADLVGCGDMPQPPRAADCLAQGLQEYFVTGQHYELDDVARKAEPRGVQRATLFVGS